MTLFELFKSSETFVFGMPINYELYTLLLNRVDGIFCCYARKIYSSQKSFI